MTAINMLAFLFFIMSFSYFSFTSHHQIPFSKPTPFHLITVDNQIDITNLK